MELQRELGEITEGIRGLHRFMEKQQEDETLRHNKIDTLLVKYDTQLSSLKSDVSVMKGIGVVFTAIFTGLSGYLHFFK